MTYTILPFGAEKRIKPDGQTWIFQPTGLCEPLTVRLEQDDAWIEATFDPLTAEISEENYNIP